MFHIFRLGLRPINIYNPQLVDLVSTCKVFETGKNLLIDQVVTVVFVKETKVGKFKRGFHKLTRPFPQICITVLAAKGSCCLIRVLFYNTKQLDL